MSKPLRIYILDMLNDCETLELLIELLNSEVGWSDEWGGDFAKYEIVAELQTMVLDGLVGVLRPDISDKHLSPVERPNWAHFDEATWWFERTERGNAMLDEWFDERRMARDS